MSEMQAVHWLRHTLPTVHRARAALLRMLRCILDDPPAALTSFPPGGGGTEAPVPVAHTPVAMALLHRTPLLQSTRLPIKPRTPQTKLWTRPRTLRSPPPTHS